ncbi:molybdopterin-binding protein [Cellulomonas sp. PhB143]|uniref:TOBE domain-containing protein n=1 Tax=Cellulomonas sp. PhB143 TaxID=2485186 RepID=UPI000F460F26|nr:helix-turn-helix transcriptional regulator [Cellulomonas sp. PhB143]ROS72129.1 molybdopterin-binding protein [Cellulomonas sp. PhB143]
MPQNRNDQPPVYRISEAAGLLGVSDDTVRRWVAAGELTTSKDDAGRQVVDGAELARHAVGHADAGPDPLDGATSARNRFAGIVTAIESDRVMSQVEILSRGQRVVSLMSTEAVRDLGLAPGSPAVAVVKATTVIVETPGARA